MKVIWSGDAWNDYLHGQKSDPDVVNRISALIANARRTPFEGIGKPEPLRGRLAGWSSRRITVTHRLVYRAEGNGADQELEIASCRLHYQS